MFRYVRLLGSLARFSLLGEMAFRTNYLLKVAVEVLWLCLLLLFYQTIFGKTSAVGGWTKPEYLFFLGCYTALEGLLETFVLGNVSEFSELVRTGELDIILLRPIDEQFLVSFRRIEWSSVPNVLLGTGLMIYGLIEQNWAFDALRLAAFAVGFACAATMAYSFLIMLSATAVWMVPQPEPVRTLVALHELDARIRARSSPARGPRPSARSSRLSFQSCS